MKPNFLVIGAPKAATTTICALLQEHPDVYMFPRKGTQFFNRRYEFGFEWYERLFDEANGESAVGEGSPGYAAEPTTPRTAQRIAEYLPDVRLIYVVRDPIRRIESHYAQTVDNGREYESFGAAVRECTPLMEASRYWARLNDYRAHFADDQILVLFYEDFKADSRSVLRRCFEFLDVDPTFEVSDSSMARNTRADKKVDRRVLRWIRKHPSYVKLQWALPQWVTDRLKPVLRRRVTVDVSWDQETLDWVQEELADDSRQFLEFFDKPADYWRS